MLLQDPYKTFYLLSMQMLMAQTLLYLVAIEGAELSCITPLAAYGGTAVK